MLWLVVKPHMGHSSYVYVYNEDYAIQKDLIIIVFTYLYNLILRVGSEANCIGRVSINVTSSVWRDMTESAVSLNLHDVWWGRSMV